MNKISTKCCIAGGGPAGVMLGFLLARSGVDVVVLEKWPDFFRDFRGDTIHPSTMDIMHELGLLEEFLKLPHQEIREIYASIGQWEVPMGDFGHLRVRCPFLAFIPQWDFLNFIASEGKKYPGFHLMMETEATDLIYEGKKVAGVMAKSKNETIEIRAELVVGADGRHSTIRERLQLPAASLGAPMDVLWFRIPRMDSDPVPVLGRLERGKMMVMIDRDDYWQCGFVIPKGRFESIKAEGLSKFCESVRHLASFAKDRELGISSWDQIKLLTVTVDRLIKWHKDGVICIGDAAHAMSPIGGVGINLAIQDAVAAANILSNAFQSPSGVRTEDLERIQKRREFPTKITQRMQLFIQDHVIFKVLNNTFALKLPWPLWLLKHFPVLRRIPARLVGVGFRPEHVHSKVLDQKIIKQAVYENQS